jgi:MATE family multidrug resistance protein
MSRQRESKGAVVFAGARILTLLTNWRRKVLALAVPIILANMTTPLIGAVDTAVVGHLPSPSFIGGVAIGAVIFNFLFWGLGFLRMATTAFTAQALGREDRSEIGFTAQRAAAVAVTLGLAIIVLQSPVAWFAFPLMDASPEVTGHARTYYDIRVWSAPAALLNYVLLGWFLGQQRAKTALALQLSLNVINVSLDFLFVMGLSWGIAGVAWASLVAEYSAAVFGIVLAARLPGIRIFAFERAAFLNRERLMALFRVNRDIFLRTITLLFAFGYFTAQSASMGDELLAANAILLQILSFQAYGLDGFAHAVEILVGESVGRRSRQDFRAAIRASTELAFFCAVLSAFVLWLLDQEIVNLFTDIERVRAATMVYLPWVIASPMLSIWCYQLDGVFFGAAWSGAIRNALFLALVLYLGACWLLIPVFGNHGLWLSLMILSVLRAVTLLPALKRLDASFSVSCGAASSPTGRTG